jgi:hypothetical protein
MAWGFVSDAGEGFAILIAGFATVGVLDASLGHKVALIAAVGKDPGGPLLAVHRRDAANVLALEMYTAMLFQLFVEAEVDVSIREQFAKDLFVHVRLRAPVRGLVKVRDAVVCRGLHIEIAGIAADDFKFAKVGGRESAGDHASDMVAGLKQDHMETFFGGGVGRHHSGGGGPVDDEVSRLSGTRNSTEQGKRAGETSETGHEDNVPRGSVSNPVTCGMLLRYIGPAGWISRVGVKSDGPATDDVVAFGFDVDNHLEVTGRAIALVNLLKEVVPDLRGKH